MRSPNASTSSPSEPATSVCASVPMRWTSASPARTAQTRPSCQESKDYPGSSICHVEVEVANFYPAIASTISRWLYENTQSRIHVLVTHGFLRGLARLELAESRAKRFASIDDLPDPVPAREQAASRGAPSRSAA